MLVSEPASSKEHPTGTQVPLAGPYEGPWELSMALLYPQVNRMTRLTMASSLRPVTTVPPVLSAHPKGHQQHSTEGTMRPMGRALLTALKDASRGQWPKQCCRKTYSFCWTNRGTAALWGWKGRKLSHVQGCVSVHRASPGVSLFRQQETLSTGPCGKMCF